jgi:hypothetical protein
MYLREFLGETKVKSARGVPMGRVPNVFLHIVLSGADQTIVISGQAVDMAGGTEAFFLTQEDFDPNRWVKSLDDPSVWEAQNLALDSAIERILSSKRTIRYYFSSVDRKHGLGPIGPLDSASALEFVEKFGADDQRVVFYATPDYPGAVEIATVPKRCKEILQSLQEFQATSPEKTLLSQGGY